MSYLWCEGAPQRLPDECCFGWSSPSRGQSLPAVQRPPPSSSGKNHLQGLPHETPKIDTTETEPEPSDTVRQVLLPGCQVRREPGRRGLHPGTTSTSSRTAKFSTWNAMTVYADPKTTNATRSTPTRARPMRPDATPSSSTGTPRSTPVIRER